MLPPPYPSLPQPATWTAGTQFLTSVLRGDLTNAASLLSSKPLFVGSQTTTNQALAANISNLVKVDTENVDGWGMHTIPSSTISSRFPGWYLLDGYAEGASIAATQAMATGIRQVQNGTVTDVYGGQGPGNGTNDQGYTAASLVYLDPSTGDECALIANPSFGCNCVKADVTAEWVAMPTTSAVWPTGVVVTSPQPASPFPAGTTTVTNPGGIPAGATSMTVADPTGMVTGGVLGLDYMAGQPVSPMAETVTITSVAGAVIGITATSYPHGGALSPGAVAVPVSAPFMNAQSRDMIRFLCYPPIAAASFGTGVTSVPSQAWPNGTQVPLPLVTVDNFGGLSSGTYTFPVSGVYYLYGHVLFGPTASYSMAAGLSVSGGTIQWGTSVRNSSASPLVLGATVRRHLRVTAGQTVQLFATQNSGNPLLLNNNGLSLSSRLVVVFRGF